MTKILLVEDDKSLREIYGVRLLAEGYDIVSAGDGEEALAMAIKEKPSLIVSDVMMPKISGFDMLDILRSTTETKGIKVIMMTALSSDDQRQRSEQLGADRYLVKSQVGIEDVVRTIHEVLGDIPGVGTQPVPQPQPAAAPAPLPTPAPAAAPEAPAAALPQPTAPFSTPRPSGLGDRIINPIEHAEKTGPDVADLMSQELDTPPAIPQEPVEAPAPATVPEPVVVEAPEAPEATTSAPVTEPVDSPEPVLEPETAPETPDASVATEEAPVAPEPATPAPVAPPTVPPAQPTEQQ